MGFIDQKEARSLAAEIAARMAAQQTPHLEAVEDDLFAPRQADMGPRFLKQGPPKVDKALQKALSDAEKMLSRNLKMMLRRAMGPRAMPFFDLYVTLRKVSVGMPPPEGLVEQYVGSVRALTRVTGRDGRKIAPPIINDLIERTGKMRSWLGRIERGGLVGDPTWKRINENYGNDIVRIARDKGVFMKGRPIGRQRWRKFRKMRPREERIERLKDEDPQAYEAVMLKRLTKSEIESRIIENIEAEGLVPQTLSVMYRSVKVGVDPLYLDELREHESQKPKKPRRLREGEEPSERWSRQKKEWDVWVDKMSSLRQESTTVYDLDGDVLGVDQFKEKVLKQRERSSNAKKKLLPKEQVEALRKVDDATLDELDTPKSYMALTDDAAKHQAMSKIYAVQEIMDPDLGEMRKVVVAGRYRGCYADDLVNEQGRLIEGTGWVYQPGSRRGQRVKKRIDPSDLEPYATVSEERPGHLYLSLPGKVGRRGEGKHNDTVVKEIMERLANRVGPPGIVGPDKTKVKDYRGKTQYKASYYIAPENFALIRQEIGGMALSSTAMKTMDRYFADLARAEQATAKENLKFYEAEQIGGFKGYIKKPGKEPREVKLLTKQKQALAWLEANGDKGVVALDTGVGKCVVGETLILTTDGLVRIEDLNPGVTEPDTTVPMEGRSVIVGGETMPIKNFYFGGEKPTIKVSTRYGFEVEGSRVHPLLVRTPGGVQEWIKTSELREGDFLCVERREGEFPQVEPLLPQPTKGTWRNEYQTPERMNPELARLLGYILAEGWTNHGRMFTITQHHDKNPRVREDIESLLKSQFGVEVAQGQEENTIQVCSSQLCEYLEHLGINRHTSRNKEIPASIHGSTKESMRQFLRGFIDAEGSVTPGRGVEFSSASETLAREVQVMLLRFGIVARRRPKKAKGYDHTYWYLQIFGDDARLFAQKIGLVSERKIAGLAEAVERSSNPNHDVVPHMASLIEELHQEIMRWWGGDVASFRERFGPSVHNTMNHVRLGRRNATYRFLREVLDVHRQIEQERENFPGRILEVSKARHKVQAIVDQNVFFDPVVTLEEGMAVVMDIEVDHKSHCFIGNGLWNHNTLTSIASMQKLLRDGWAEQGSGTNGRFLFVAPKNLTGNIKDQIYDFLTRESAEDLIGRLDVLTYAQFRNGRKKGKVKVRRKVDRKVQTFDYDPWEPEKYIAVYFDEAQALTSINTKTSQAAMSLNHPRKICLTASPMEREPMDAYVLAAVCNNIDLSKKGSEGRTLRRNMRRFKERFCEEVGGRIIGLKKISDGSLEEDELARRDLHTWTKRNIFYADKMDVEEFVLPELEQETRTVTMPKTVEKEYRKVSKGITNQLRALVEKFEKGGYIREMSTEVPAEGPATPGGELPTAEETHIHRITDPSTGEVKSIRKVPAAHDPKIEQWASKNMKPVIRKLWELSLYPEKVLDNVNTNPKIMESTNIVRDKLSEGGRTLLFTDDIKMVLRTAKELSEKVPGKIHVAMLSGKAHFFKDGAELKSYTIRDTINSKDESFTHSLPFTQRRYRRFPKSPVDPVENRHYNKGDWASFVLNQIVQPDADCVTCTLYGKKYSTGQNLQAFSTVVHLDRDTWNSEEMKQRTARSWRQGQDVPVHEIILDMKYDEPKDDQDRTMDEIRALFQMLSSKLFDKIIKDAQTTELGKEWTEEQEKRLASFLKIDQETFEMAMSPWLGGLPIML